MAIVGSANASHSSAASLVELALATDRQSVISQVLAFVEDLKRRAQRVDERFLARILKIRVKRRVGYRPARKGPTIKTFGGRVWLISTQPLNEERYKNEEAAAERGTRAAAKAAGLPEEDISWVRWVARRRFAREAKEGDTIVQIAGLGRHSGRYEVHEPCAILKKQRARNWTRFYYREPDNHCSWTDFSREANKLGVRRIGKKSTRELSAREALLLESLWR